MATMMERTTQKYEKLLFVAGGNLNLAKGHCYILTWKWDPKGTATMNTIEETPAEIYLTHGRDNTRIKILRKETNESCKTLGCHPSPDGGNKGQYEILMKKAIGYGAAARHRGTNKTLAYMKHNAYFTPGINYPLAVSNIPHKDLKNIETKYLKPTKQQMGFRSTVSNALIHAPRAYLGIGLSSITVSSDILHLRMLCGHVRENGRLSNTLFTTMGSLQIQSGLIKPIFHSPKSHATWCEKGWIRKCWEILQDHKIVFNCPSQVCPKLLRIRDAIIMEVFTKSNKFKPWQMRILNRCRIYMNVITISDIATACGTAINWTRWRKENPAPVEYSPYKFPIQPKPDDTQMKVWISAIRKCIIISRKDKRLKIPLGDWTGRPRQRFEWYTRPNNFSLIHIPANGDPRQHIHKKAHHNSKGGLREYHKQSRNYSDNLTTTEMTNLLHADIIRMKSRTIRLQHSTHQYIQLEPTPKQKATTVQGYIEQMPPFFATLSPH
jgi:hypothetical protein